MDANSWLQKAYKYVSDDPRDPLVKNTPLLSTPFPMIAILLSYYYFCKYIGPQMMKNRKAFNLKPVLIIYNTLQIIASAWFFYQCILYAWPVRYKFFCEPLDYTNSEVNLWVLKAQSAYYWQKIVDLLDTVFFVLRKKFSQITFLHMYHHILMVIGLYMGAKYFPGGHGTMLGQINSFVHTIMYSYYLMTSINPEYGKIVWFKKNITKIQMVQFVLLTFQSLPTLFWEKCDYPKYLRVFLTIQSIFMLCLFGNFYKSAYCKKKTE